jgi:hypothetical protein
LGKVEVGRSPISFNLLKRNGIFIGWTFFGNVIGPPGHEGIFKYGTGVTSYPSRTGTLEFRPRTVEVHII